MFRFILGKEDKVNTFTFNHFYELDGLYTTAQRQSLFGPYTFFDKNNFSVKTTQISQMILFLKTRQIFDFILKRIISNTRTI